MSSVADFIAEELNKTPEAQAAAGTGQKKMIVVLESLDKQKLDAIAAATRSGKMDLLNKFASAAITEAFNVCVTAGKIDPASLEVAGAKPKPRKTKTTEEPASE